MCLEAEFVAVLLRAFPPQLSSLGTGATVFHVLIASPRRILEETCSCRRRPPAGTPLTDQALCNAVGDSVARIGRRPLRADTRRSHEGVGGPAANPHYRNRARER